MANGSNATWQEFSPTLGWWDGTEASAPAGSMTTGQNWLVREGRLMLRPRLALFGSATGARGALGQAPLGSAKYTSSHGTRFPIADGHIEDAWHAMKQIDTTTWTEEL